MKKRKAKTVAWLGFIEPANIFALKLLWLVQSLDLSAFDVHFPLPQEYVECLGHRGGSRLISHLKLHMAWAHAGHLRSTKVLSVKV